MTSKVIGDNVGDIPFVGAHRGACVGHENPDLWHTEGQTPEARELKRQAIAICATCPVIEECKQYALKFWDIEGVWGGTTRGSRRGIVAREKLEQTSMLYKQSAGLIW